MTHFEAFCAGFQISREGFNGEILSDYGNDVSEDSRIKASWEQICKVPDMNPMVRAEMIRQLAEHILDIDKAALLDFSWAILYADGERLGRVSSRYLLIALLDGLTQIDLHTDNGSEPVDISGATRLEFSVG